jgi:hypothetical protein
MFWGSTTATTSVTIELNTVASDITASLAELREALEAVRFDPPRLPAYFPPAPRRHRLEKARHGFQQMARIPCYRGARTR